MYIGLRVWGLGFRGLGIRVYIEALIYLPLSVAEPKL